MATLEEGIQDILNRVGSFLTTVINGIAATFEDAFDGVAGLISGLIDRAVGSITSLVNDVAGYLGGVFDSVVTAVSDAVGNIGTYVANLANSVAERVRDLYESAVAGVAGVTDYIVGQIGELVAGVWERLNTLYDTVQARVLVLVTKAEQFIRDAVDTLTLNIRALVDKAAAFLGDVFDAVQSGVSFLLEKAGEVIAHVTEVVGDFFARVLDVTGQTLRDLLEVIGGLPERVSDLAESLVNSAKENIAEPLGELPKLLFEFVFGTEAEAAEPMSERLRAAVEAGAGGSFDSDEARAQIRDLFEAVGPGNWLMRSLLALAVSVGSAFVVPATLAQADAQKVLQEGSLTNPWQVLPAVDAVTAFRRGLYTRDQAREVIRRSGYSMEDAERLIEGTTALPPIGEVVSWWLRGIAGEGDLDTVLEYQGWRPEDIGRLKEAVFFIPPVADLIQMAVREAFTPDIAERFGQYEDFPQPFADLARQQGVSEENARRYWAAHWALPSVNHGFEMLHRGIITEEDLALLLRALDIMPFWRGRLIELSYNPLTRVDVRRMHALGVLDRDQVKRAYLDLGYNDLNAERLTDFTERLNAPPPADDEEEGTAITRAQVVGFYTRGIVDRTQAEGLLRDLGYTAETAALYLDDADLREEASLRDQEADLVVSLVLSGRLTDAAARDRLVQAGFEALEVEAVFQRIDRQREDVSKLPSRSDLDRMLKGGLVDRTLYLDTMNRLGYAETWAERYLALATGEA